METAPSSSARVLPMPNLLRSQFLPMNAFRASSKALKAGIAKEGP